MKGQIASQIFVYMLGIIVVGVILLVGIRGLDIIQENNCRAQETKFATGLSSLIEKNKKYGVSKTEELALPCDAQQVCFVSRDIIDQFPTNDEGVDGTMKNLLTSLSAPIIAVSVVDDNIPVNVYLKRNDNTYEGVDYFSNTAPISLPQTKPVLCFSGDPIQIRFKGQGQLVEVALVEGS